MQEKLFTKLKWYPFKLLFTIAVSLFFMYNFNNGEVYAAAFGVSLFVIIFFVFVYPIFMKDQTKKHLQEIKGSDMEYHDYFKLGLEVKWIHMTAFVIMLPVAVFCLILLFTAFVTLFILVGYCVSYRWSSKIAKIGLDKAYEEKLLSKKEHKLYSLCQYICFWDWVSLKYLAHKL